MAGTAVICENAVVVVILNMATHTFNIGVDEDLGFMAIHALDVSVLTQQWKRRQVMVEEWCLFPENFVVAVSTLVSLRSFMHIVIKMTG